MPLDQSQWLIYGATGYTGRLIAQEAVRLGMKPFLGGRNQATLRPLADSLGLTTRCFSLQDPQESHRGLAGMTLVLNCAGPFSQTAKAMLGACLQTSCHYLDITGEIEVFEYIFGQRAALAKAGILALPGVGYDVVPSDCLAAMLAVRLLEVGGGKPHQLDLAFRTNGGISRGTLKTMIENLPHGSMERKGGTIARIPWVSITRNLPISRELGCAIPWGDVSTAFYSTGAPNIRVFTPAPKLLRLFLKGINGSQNLLPWPLLIKLLQAFVERTVDGPTAEARPNHRTTLWGEISDVSGKRVAATLKCGDGYDVTVWAALKCVERVLSEPQPSEAKTPSQLLGGDFILSMPGVSMEWLKV